ncbi:MAG: DUF4870 domain-containing protein [Bacteroidota bacterium]
MDREGILDDNPDEYYHPDENERLLATLSNLGIIAGCVVPLGSILTPLVIWLVKKEESPFIDRQAKEALNFQITMTILTIISALMVILLIGIFFVFAVLLLNLILSIIAAVHVNKGEEYEYPLNFRIIR